MDLFSRYIFRQAAGSFLLILLTLTAIVWLATALSRLELLTAQGQGIFLFLKMTMLALPNLFAFIAPNAFLLASLTTLDRLNGDSELIVMTASGAAIWRFAAPLLILASLVAMIIVSVNFYIQPWSARLLRNYVTQVRTDLISQVLRPGHFSSPEPGLTFHIADRALNGHLEGLVVHDERDPKQIMSILAKQGHIVKTEEGAFLVMTDGHIQRYNAVRNERNVQIVKFEQYVFDISQFGPKSDVQEIKPRARYLSELISPKPGDSYFKRFPGKFRSELHNRLATPLYPFAYALITIAFLGGVRTVRQNRWGSVFAAFACAVGVRVGGLAAMNMLTLQAWAVVFVYGVPLATIMAAALSVKYQLSRGALSIWSAKFDAKLRASWPNFSQQGMSITSPHGGVR